MYPLISNPMFWHGLGSSITGITVYLGSLAIGPNGQILTNPLPAQSSPNRLEVVPLPPIKIEVPSPAPAPTTNPPTIPVLPPLKTDSTNSPDPSIPSLPPLSIQPGVVEPAPFPRLSSNASNVKPELAPQPQSYLSVPPKSNEIAPPPRLETESIPAPRSAIVDYPPAQLQPASPALPTKPTGINLRGPESGHTFKFKGDALDLSNQTAMPVPPTPVTGAPEMTMTPRQLLLSAIAGVSLSLTNASAQSTGNPSDSKLGKESTQSEKTSDSVTRQELTDLKKSIEDLTRFRRDIDDLLFGKKDSTSILDTGILKRLSELEEGLKRINSSLTRIEERLQNQPRSTSGFGPSTSTTTTRGTIRLVNDYPTDLSIVLNGISHRLSPGQIKNVEVNPGSYSYELLVPGAQVTNDTIREGQTITLRIK